MPKGTNRRREASCATSRPIRVILKAVFLIVSAMTVISQSPALAMAAGQRWPRNAYVDYAVGSPGP